MTMITSQTFKTDFADAFNILHGSMSNIIKDVSSDMFIDHTV